MNKIAFVEGGHMGTAYPSGAHEFTFGF